MEINEISFTQKATRQTMEETIQALHPRGIRAELIETKEEALERLKALIPPGASVMTASSQTLDEIGLTDYLKGGGHPWQNLKEKIVHEKDGVQQNKLRIESSMADYYLGSVHALSKRGEMVFASASGSQLPAYCFNSKNIIWVVGAQKITSNVASALERVMEYCLPKEDEHQRQRGNSNGSFLGKLLIFEREAPFLHRNIHLLLVNESLGV